MKIEEIRNDYAQELDFLTQNFKGLQESASDLLPFFYYFFERPGAFTACLVWSLQNQASVDRLLNSPLMYDFITTHAPDIMKGTNPLNFVFGILRQLTDNEAVMAFIKAAENTPCGIKHMHTFSLAGEESEAMVHLPVKSFPRAKLNINVTPENIMVLYKHFGSFTLELFIEQRPSNNIEIEQGYSQNIEKVVAALKANFALPIEESLDQLSRLITFYLERKVQSWKRENAKKLICELLKGSFSPSDFTQYSQLLYLFSPRELGPDVIKTFTFTALEKFLSDIKEKYLSKTNYTVIGEIFLCKLLEGSDSSSEMLDLIVNFIIEHPKALKSPSFRILKGKLKPVVAERMRLLMETYQDFIDKLSIPSTHKEYSEIKLTWRSILKPFINLHSLNKEHSIPSISLKSLIFSKAMRIQEPSEWLKTLDIFVIEPQDPSQEEVDECRYKKATFLIQGLFAVNNPLLYKQITTFINENLNLKNWELYLTFRNVAFYRKKPPLYWAVSKVVDYNRNFLLREFLNYRKPNLSLLSYFLTTIKEFDFKKNLLNTLIEKQLLTRITTLELLLEIKYLASEDRRENALLMYSLLSKEKCPQNFLHTHRNKIDIYLFQIILEKTFINPSLFSDSMELPIQANIIAEMNLTSQESSELMINLTTKIVKNAYRSWNWMADEFKDFVSYIKKGLLLNADKYAFSHLLLELLHLLKRRSQLWDEFFLILKFAPRLPGPFIDKILIEVVQSYKLTALNMQQLCHHKPSHEGLLSAFSYVFLHNKLPTILILYQNIPIPIPSEIITHAFINFFKNRVVDPQNEIFLFLMGLKPSFTALSEAFIEVVSLVIVQMAIDLYQALKQTLPLEEPSLDPILWKAFFRSLQKRHYNRADWLLKQMTSPILELHSVSIQTQIADLFLSYCEAPEVSLTLTSTEYLLEKIPAGEIKNKLLIQVLLQLQAPDSNRPPRTTSPTEIIKSILSDFTQESRDELLSRLSLTENHPMKEAIIDFNQQNLWSEAGLLNAIKNAAENNEKEVIQELYLSYQRNFSENSLIFLLPIMTKMQPTSLSDKIITHLYVHYKWTTAQRDQFFQIALEHNYSGLMNTLSKSEDLPSLEGWKRAKELACQKQPGMMHFLKIMKPRFFPPAPLREKNFSSPSLEGPLPG